MKRAFYILTLILSYFASYGADLSGLVLDEKNQTPIPYATIQFVDLNTGVVCDENGKFYFSGDLPQHILAKISAIGYETRLLKLYASRDVITIVLHPSHIELEEFVVSTMGELQNSTITNVEKRSIEELHVIPSANLVEAVSNIPGVYNSNTGIGISKPVIRGLSGIRVVTYLNNLRIENQQWGGDHGLGINDNGLGSVEVIKGPASLLYGADALGGVIYLKEEAFANQNTKEGYYNSQFETNSFKSNQSFGVKLSGTRLSFNLFGNYTAASDYQLPGGDYLKNSRFTQSDIKASIGYHRKNWLVTVRYNYNQSRIGIPGHTHDSIVTQEAFISSNQGRKNTIPAQFITNHHLLVENVFYFKQSKLTLRNGYTSNNLQEYEEKYSIPAIDMLLSNYFNTAIWSRELTENQSLKIGGQVMILQTSNGVNAEEQLIPNGSTQDLGAFVIYQGDIKTWKYQLGVRFDQRVLFSSTEDNMAWQRSFMGGNYSAGVNKKLDVFVLRANFSTGFRPPHSSEMVVNGVHHGSFRYEIGNENLISEKASQIDVGVEYGGEHLSISVNPYLMSIKNFIYLQPTDSLVDSYAVYEYHQDELTTLKGADISLHYHPHFLHRLHLEHNTSFVGAIKSDNSHVSLIPPARTNTVVKYQLDSKGIVSFKYVALQHLYFFQQKMVSAPEIASEAYHLINLSMNVEFKFKYPLELKLGVTNVLNSEFVPHLSRLKPFQIPAPGRNFTIGLKIKF